MSEVYPESEEQRCWNHKTLSVLDHLPRRVQPQAREMLCRMPYAETRKACERLQTQFNNVFGAAYPKAVATLERDWDRMITFYRFPKEHRVHLRTTNVIESPFASVRLRTNAAKRYRNTTNATVLIWRLLMVDESRFRRLKRHHLLPGVYMGAKYVDGIPVADGKALKERIAARGIYTPIDMSSLSFETAVWLRSAHYGSTEEAKVGCEILHGRFFDRLVCLTGSTFCASQ